MDLKLLPFKALLISLDGLITFLTFGWIPAIKHLLKKTTLRSVPVGDDPSHRVDPRSKDQLATIPFPGVDTLHEIVTHAFKIHGPKTCLSYREYLGMHTDKPPVKNFGKIINITYEVVRNESLKFGAALRKAGLTSAPEVATLEAIVTPCSIAIFENTCKEWLISAMGAFSQSIIVTTIYATLGMDAVINAVKEGVISAIVCNKRSVSAIVSKLNDMPSLNTIIYTNDQVGPEDKIDLPSAPAGTQIVSFENFVASGNEVAFPIVPPKPSTMAVLMYTSGSTGKPKGVVITHAQATSALTSASSHLQSNPDTDAYLGYLPLAHILEFMTEFVMVYDGVKICYADPKILTNRGAYPTGALEAFSPTIMAGVPKIWDVIKKGVEAKINASGAVAKFLVQTAFQAKTFAIHHGYDTPLFNALVFKKLSNAVGGRLKIAVSGGGPLNAEVQSFIRTCFGTIMVQGYGLTESCGGVSGQSLDDLRPFVVGQPILSAEVRVVSCPDIKDKNSAPYLSTDTEDANGDKVTGRGEIQIRGNNVSLGYYMMQEKTDEVYGKDGFFSTGDIGQFMSDGSLRIVDRVKNLVKLKGGEYVAIENMEMVYSDSSYVDALAGGICCYGDGDMDRPVALVQVGKSAAMNWASDNGITGGFEEIVASKEFNDYVLKDLQKVGMNGGLSRLEKLQAVSLLSSPWTNENGCLTAAGKLDRRRIVESFTKQFEAVREKGIF